MVDTFIGPLVVPADDVPDCIKTQAQHIRSCLSNDVFKQVGWNSDRALHSALMRPRYLHYGEIFCGWGIVYESLKAMGFSGFFLDITINKDHNLLTPQGLIHALNMLLLVCIRGFVWLGVPCSTWVWIARGHTMRSASNWAGDTSRTDVHEANELVGIVAFLLQLLVMRQVFYLIEQPASSLMFKHPALRRHFKKGTRRPKVFKTKLKAHHVWLGSWGHSLYKGTWLVGVLPGLKSLKSKRTRSATVVAHWKKTSVRKSGPRKGSWRICGCKSLKDTGRYPRKFGEAVAKLAAAAICSTKL